MTLRDYLYHNRITCTDFGRKVECSRNYITLIKNKKFIPSLRLARDIEAATDGLVTVRELMSK